MTQPTGGFDWLDPYVRARAVVKRRIPTRSPNTLYECNGCGRVFRRKDVGYGSDGWYCRRRCFYLDKPKTAQPSHRARQE